MPHQLSGLFKFFKQEPWAGHFARLYIEHCSAALDQFGVRPSDLPDLIGEDAHTNVWGCVFEDLLTRRYGSDHANMVDAYLKRRGWNESAATRAHMLALRESRMDLYEASDIVPGKSVRVRSLLAGGDPVLVHEGTATRMLKPWAHFAARVVPDRNRHIFSGGMHALSRKASESLQEQARYLGVSQLSPAAFTHAWLSDALADATGQTPDSIIVNSDGDPIEFHIMRFPIRAGVTPQEIRARLQPVEALRPADDWFWNWITDPQPNPAGENFGHAWITTMEDGATVLGTLEIKDGIVVLDVNSPGRAERGEAMLRAALGDAILPPATEIKSLGQMRAATAATPRSAAPKPDLPPAQLKSMLHDMLDRQYRASLDAPVPVLGNLTPRAAILTESGRHQVADWLKYLENQSASFVDPSDPMASYDFTWLWQELQITDLRR